MKEKELTNQASGWRGEIELVFQKRGAGSVLAINKHSGPLQVQKPFYPEGVDIPHVYLLHPPGGVVGGDQLEIKVEVQDNANVLITTPAAGKLYRSKANIARLEQRFKVQLGGCLEWLPQETILYAGSCVKMDTRIDIESGGNFVGMDILCLGRPASGERFHFGWFEQQVEIWLDGELLRFERLQIPGGGKILEASWGLQGYSVVGQFISVCCEKGFDNLIRQQVLSGFPEQMFAVTQINGVLICRILGKQSEHVKQTLISCWEIMRKSHLNRETTYPRVWNT